MSEHGICGRTRKRMQVCMDPDAIELINELAKKLGMSRGDLIARAVKFYYEQLKKMNIYA